MMPCPECKLSSMHLDSCSRKPSKPRWRCWNPEYGNADDGRDIGAYSAWTAAHDFAEEECSDDPESYRSYEDGCVVMVRSEDGKLSKFMVTGQPSFTFHPSEMTRR